ncbi:MAG: hypothetical protein U0694_16100 [Anaerolineae bacterium]
MDGAYSVHSLLVTGQWDTARAHLRAIRDISRAINGATGKVIHEMTLDGVQVSRRRTPPQATPTRRRSLPSLLISILGLVRR